MALYWIVLIVSLIGVNAEGEFTVLHSPKSLRFSSSTKTLESFLKEIFSASLGLSVEGNSDWNGLSIVDPFDTPEAIVEVYVDGVPSLGNSAGLKAVSYGLTVDEYEPETFFAISHRIKQRFTNGQNRLVNIKLSEPDDLASYSNLFGNIPAPKVGKQHLQHLKYDKYEEDYQFLFELETLKAIIEKIKSGAVAADNAVDFYNFRMTSLHTLSDFHGPMSLQTKEAKKLLGETLNSLSEAFVKAYDGSVLVTVVTTDVAHTRRTVRAAPADPMQEPYEDDKYSSDYAAIFNILLWFGIIFTFTLVAIVYAIMDMDPGRDSIIYRMTSTRMKKDN
ncbi:unnamed protein product [Leptidea sinapis]|uniref:Renin receptor n=1 Tax=Leptidea sinapis TaxID=189913 RepID=A0A5E4QJ79_9NEOP|nr:unnamed protein product [Leptidea sinapis]